MNKVTPNHEKINVLEITGNGVVGGMESYVSRLAERLPEDRFRLFCLCPFEGAFTARLRGLGAEVYVTRIDDDPRWRSIHFAAGLIQQCGIDVIHAHLSNAHVLAGIVGRLTNTPALVTIHGRLIPLTDLEAHFACDTHLSVVCQPAYLHAIGLGIRHDRVHLIPNGVDERVFKPSGRSESLHKALELAPDTLLVGQVGRLAPEKGPEVFLNMAWIVHQRLPKAHFVLVGDGPLKRRIAARIAELGMKNYVHFAGALTDMPDVYASLDVVVSSSHTEGMPLALMEAMACGRPVVATHVGSVGEMISMGETGWLVDPEQPDSLADAVIKLLEDPPGREAMGNAARQRAVKAYPLAASVEAMGNLLSTLARTAPQPKTQLTPAPPVKPSKSNRLPAKVASLSRRRSS